MKLLRPFGPSIGISIIPQDIFLELNNITDSVLKNKNLQENISFNFLTSDYKSSYPVKKQFKLMLTKEISDWIKYQILAYVTEYNKQIPYKDQPLSNIRKISINACWFNSMTTGEDLPPHQHHGTVSGVLYCKIPTDALPTDGIISFVNTSCSDELEMASIQVRPIEKQMYLFPSRLIHSVTGIHSDQERRSISFNAFINYD